MYDNESEQSIDCFKIISFNIDSYVTKPHLIYDETYSSYRKCNINLATVVRVFGSTENGIKTCIHIHQHFPHLSIRQQDLAKAYGLILDEENPKINQKVLDTFVNDLENELLKYVNLCPNNQSKNEIIIVNIEKCSAFSFYGYHDKQETFYKVHFNSYWMANKAKNLLESRLINNYHFVCYNFLEFLLQFYIDHQIYLNTFYFKKVTLRKRSEENESIYPADEFDLIRKKKLESIKNFLSYNDLEPSSTCSLECDALITDILRIENKLTFPKNTIFNPTLPSIINLWNNQYKRSPEEFENLLKVLKNPEKYSRNYEGYQFQLKKFHIFDSKIQAIPQFDGTNDDSNLSNDDSFCIFQNKQIEIIPDQFKNGFVCLPKLNCFGKNLTNNLHLFVGKSHISVKDISKHELIYSIDKKIRLFTLSEMYLNLLKQKLKTYKLTNPFTSEQKIDSKSPRILKLRFLTTNPNLSQQLSISQRFKNLRTLLNKSCTFEKTSFLNNVPLDQKFLNYSTIHDDSNLILELSNTQNKKIVQPNSSIKWSQCLNLTLMSLELHTRIRGNFNSDPNFDPIQMVTFTIYEELLNDHTISDVSKKKSNTLYLGSIIVQSKRLMECENIIIKNENSFIHYVSSECDLICKIAYFVQNFDPDIILGYMIDTFSWGYLLQRATILGFDIGLLFSRITNSRQSKRNFPGTLNHPPQLIGRIVINIWRLLRHELSLRSYSFENVYYNLFKKRFPKFSNEFLNMIWDKFTLKKNEMCKYFILEYYFNRVLGSLKMLTHLNFIRRTFDLSCLFGMQFQDVINRGSQFRVESMLFPLCREENFLPIRFSKSFILKQKAALSTPLILEPEILFHTEPVAVLDFQSLYPSVIIAYNYCFSTCLGRMRNILCNDDSFGCYKLLNKKNILDILDGHIHVAENDVLFVKPNIRRGIMPRMLEEILNTRILIKEELKNVDQRISMEFLSKELREKLKDLKRQLDVLQLGMKLISNVTYGYTSANFSGRMPCVEIADSIVSKGRQILEEVIAFINEWGIKSGTKAKVIYGDTDSVFISFPDSSVAKAFEMANFIRKEINKRQPYPICLKLEKIYKPCIIMAKKRYCGYAYDSSFQTKPRFDAKGIETIRRNTCNMTAKIMEKCIKILFEASGNIRSLKPYLQWEFEKILSGRLKVDDFIFAREFAGFSNYYNESIIPVCIMARKRLQSDPRNEPKFKERVPYVIVEGEEHLRVADLVRDPFDLFNDESLKLNGNYYIKNAIILPLVRVLDSVVDNGFQYLNSWYEEVKNSSKKIEILKIRHKDLEKLNLIQKNYNSHPLIEDWKSKNITNSKMIENSKPTTLILDSFWTIGHKLKHLETICSHCGGFDFKIMIGLSNSKHRHKCINICPILFRYHQAQEDFSYLSFLNQAILLKTRMHLSSS